jgi:hypothetical protein
VLYTKGANGFLLVLFSKGATFLLVTMLDWGFLTFGPFTLGLFEVRLASLDFDLMLDSLGLFFLTLANFDDYLRLIVSLN